MDQTVKVINGKEFQVEYFAEPHQDEYVLSELKDGKVNGIVQLFKRGVIQLSWKTEGGRKIGGVTMYSDGKAECTMDWKFFTGMDLRALENTKRGLQLVITDPITGIAVYRGEYSSNKEQREGRGYVYDATTGKVLYYGIFKDDKIYRYLQEFEDDKMVEYSESKESNVDLLARCPIYVGGYIFDETTDTYKRNGAGNAIDPDSGLAASESTWENGVEKEGSVRFTNGWYGPNDMVLPSLRCTVEGNEYAKSVGESVPEEKASAPVPMVPMVSMDPESPKEESSLPVEPTPTEGPGLGVTNPSLSMKHSEPELVSVPALHTSNSMTLDPVPHTESLTQPMEPVHPELIHEESHHTAPVEIPSVPIVREAQSVVPIYDPNQDVMTSTPPAQVSMSELRPPIAVPTYEYRPVALAPRFESSNPAPIPHSTEPSYSMGSYQQEIEENPLNNSTSIVIQRAMDLENISSTVVDFTVADRCCNESNITNLNLQVLTEVKRIVVGDECFMNLLGFELKGMRKLECFVVRKNSFTMSRNNKGERKDCSLTIEDCPRLSEITIGAYSFSDYCSIKLTSLPQLKTLKIGDPYEKSFCFYNSDFCLMSRFSWE